MIPIDINSDNSSAETNRERPAHLVLIVDDEASSRLMVRHILHRDGYRVIEASNGLQALELYQKTPPDIVLMDGVMPKMDGFVACQRLRELPGGDETPVLMLTGLDDADSIDEAFQVGANDYVTKPILWPVLRQRIRRLIQASRTDRELQHSEKKYRSLVNSLKEAIFQTDADYILTFLNPAWTEITGFTAEETLGQNFLSFIQSEDRDYVSTLFDNLAPQKEANRAEVRCLTKDKSYRWVELLLGLTNAEAVESGGIFGTLTDINARKQTEILEKDRTQVFEMISKRAALFDILLQIAAMVEHQRPDLECSIRVLNGATNNAAPDPAVSNYEDGYIPILAGNGQLLGAFGLIYQAQTPQPKLTSLDQKLLTEAGHLAALAIEQQQLSDQLVYQAYHDSLTGLPNRLLFQDRLEQAITQAQRYKHSVGLLSIDLDYFKGINDKWGHPVGDILLKEVALRLKNCVRESDTVARVGGDEFAIILPKIEAKTANEISKIASYVATKVNTALHEAFLIEGQQMTATGSIGISLYPQDAATLEELLSRTDDALYRSKKAGRDNFQFFGEV